jgi:hypothetical protein
MFGMHNIRVGWLTALALIASLGCQPQSDPVLDLIDTDLKNTKVDDLTRTMDFVFSERRFDQDEFRSKISTGLNRWVTYSTDKVSEIDWELDPMVQALLDNFAGMSMLDRTDEFSFVAHGRVLHSGSGLDLADCETNFRFHNDQPVRVVSTGGQRLQTVFRDRRSALGNGEDLASRSG